MVAGALLALERGNQKEYIQTIEQKFVSIKRINWATAKRSYLATKKLA
jgi:hypothetical protein